MKILNCKIEDLSPRASSFGRNIDYANDATLHLWVDELPALDGIQYKVHVGDFHHALYWGEVQGLVSFFAHDSKNETGYGGSIFRVRLEDDMVREVKGPWSSRPGVMNKHFPHSLDCVFHVRDDIGGQTGHITVFKALEALDLHFTPPTGLSMYTRAHLLRVEDPRDHEITYQPVLLKDSKKMPAAVLEMESANETFHHVHGVPHHD